MGVNVMHCTIVPLHNNVTRKNPIGTYPRGIDRIGV
jgi:hypothetical protein